MHGGDFGSAGHMLVCTGHKLGVKGEEDDEEVVLVVVAVMGEWRGALANRGAGNTRKSGFYIERGRDRVRMG